MSATNRGITGESFESSRSRPGRSGWGPSNIRITASGVGLLDWDEARVDASDLDLAELPGSGLPPERLTVVRAAATAWEAADGWTVEPSYARRQLALLQAGRNNFE